MRYRQCSNQVISKQNNHKEKWMNKTWDEWKFLQIQKCTNFILNIHNSYI